MDGIPQSTRFLAAGVASNVVFLTGYNFAISIFEHLGHPASTIYAVYYLCYIPVGHALMSLFVFGWPAEYLPSLMANAPIGITAMGIGTVVTGYLSGIQFDGMVEDWKASMFGREPPPPEEEGEFYAGLVVMVITGVWSYVLSIYVNSAKPEAKDDKKEL